MQIAKQPAVEPTLNHDTLKRHGRRHLEQLAHRLWTDFNVHDPGVTILELLCYALTDLGYRIDHPIEDLLADGETDGPLRSPLFSARQVLPTNPVTLRDYRKLLIDLDGVRNAWLRPAAETCLVDCPLDQSSPQGEKEKVKVALNGIYDVLLEREPNDNEATPDAAITAAARARLMAHRNLCEDFNSIGFVDEQFFLLCAEIELEPSADVNATWAQVCHTVQQELTPPTRFYSLAELLDRGRNATEIFAGPVLDHGFLDNDEVDRADLLETVHLSDLIRTIMAVEGVCAVKEILFTPRDSSTTPGNRWKIPVRDGHQPVLDPAASRIVFYKGMVPCPVDETRAEPLLLDLTTTDRPGAENKANLPIPKGRQRHTGRYHSFQHHFPATYGIGQSRLPESASPTRKAQARQLTGYLLFFDQLLANYFAQLSNVAKLFALDETIDRTYFTQVLTKEELPDLESLLADKVTFGDTIQAITENLRLFHKRRHRFLDHLLARFAERFSEYAAIMHSFHGDRSDGELIRDKLRYLTDIPALGLRRSTSFDYTDRAGIWNSDKNISGFERRVGRLLGIRNLKRRNLANITYDIYEERDSDTTVEYRFRVIDDVNHKILLSSSWKHLEKKAALAEMRKAVVCAMDRNRYQLLPTKDGRYYFNVVDETGGVVARRIEYFKSEEARGQAIDFLLDFLHSKYSDEGLFVVEHLLLRPRPETDDQPLPVCPPAGSNDCTGVDPYSFRLTIVLPAWPPRFAKMDFRLFVEQTLRQECPAHILPRICWISHDQMAVFEKVWQRWLRFLATGRQTTKTNPLNDLVAIVSELRSVYPEATLYNCSAEVEGRGLFLLDRTMLGTEK